MNQKEQTMNYTAHVNVICSMLYQRGERQYQPGMKTVTLKQIENVVSKYNLRENVIFTVNEIRKASTTRWGVSRTETPNLFLVCQRDWE